MSTPRLIIAATMSGSGKTTVTTVLIGALRARGLRVAPFKVGPDYIDPTYLSLSAGRAARNLDGWMLTQNCIVQLFEHGSRDADIAIIEGVMGLFDGFSGGDDTGSTAHVARILDAPILLVIDVSAMARTAAAVVKGLCNFDSSIHIAGVILNCVGSEKHAEMVRDAIESSTGVPVLGQLLKEDDLSLPERHLGLIPTLEPGRWRAWLEAAIEKFSANLNLERILEVANSAPELEISGDDPFAVREPKSFAIIAVARDAAFNFIYEDNLEMLRSAGAEIVFFSPMADQALPHGTQAVYLCGGFPEIYAEELAANHKMRAEMRSAFYAGMPMYAECGGLMYLTEGIIDGQNRSHSMVGVLPGRSMMTGKLTLGYRETRAMVDSWLWREGEVMRGHEFHYSTWENPTKELPAAYELLPNAFQKGLCREGVCLGSLIASYVHLHFLARPELARRFVQAATRG